MIPHMRLIFTGVALAIAAQSASAELLGQADVAAMTRGMAPVVAHAAPAVVNIYAKRVVQTQSNPFADNPFFREFFQDFGRTESRVQNSLGSGVILSKDGYLVTNYHVVGRATDIRVVLKDRREFSAQVMLGDEESDLAILRLNEAADVPVLELRDSDAVEVGELVLAIGNPFGVGQTVSSGIISGLARSGTATGNARGFFIQTDAPINPGNSGGALVDMAGRLVGVNTSILTRSGGSNGIGFAIPAALVAQFLEQAQEGRAVFTRPWAGLAGQAVDGDIANAFGLPFPEGVLISDVHSQSSFAAAGIDPGDILTKADGQAVFAPAEMLFRMSVKGPGSQIKIERLRDGVRLEVTVDLVEAPAGGPDFVVPDVALFSGLTLGLVGPSDIVAFDLPLAAEGIVVRDPGPIGRRVGLEAGDVLRAINREEVTAPEDAPGRLDAAQELGQFELILERRGQRVTLRFRS